MTDPIIKRMDLRKVDPLPCKYCGSLPHIKSLPNRAERTLQAECSNFTCVIQHKEHRHFTSYPTVREATIAWNKTNRRHRRVSHPRSTKENSPMIGVKIGKLNHANLITNDLEGTAAFYEQLGLRRGSRPAFPTAGIWMYCDDEPVLHLNEPAIDEFPQHHHGHFNHIGFDIHGNIEAVCNRLKELNINYTMDDDYWDRIAGLRRACYFFGPAGEKIELVFVDVAVDGVTIPTKTEKQPA